MNSLIHIHQKIVNYFQPILTVTVRKIELRIYNLSESNKVIKAILSRDNKHETNEAPAGTQESQSRTSDLKENFEEPWEREEHSHNYCNQK